MSIRGVYKNGAVQLLDEVELEENQKITIVPDKEASSIIENIDELEELRLQKVREEVEASSQRIKKRMKGRNKDRITTNEEIESNCF